MTSSNLTSPTGTPRVCWRPPRNGWVKRFICWIHPMASPPQDTIGNDAKFQGLFRDVSLDAVKEKVHGDHVRIVKGHFASSAAQLPADAAFSSVHLDCDLYKPFASALPYFWSRLAPGSFLIMHDYTTECIGTAWRKTCDEGFAGKEKSMIPIPDIAGIVVKRKNKLPMV